MQLYSRTKAKVVVKLVAEAGKRYNESHVVKLNLERRNFSKSNLKTKLQ